jgi:AraC-like DNA-binding protein
VSGTSGMGTAVGPLLAGLPAALARLFRGTGRTVRQSIVQARIERCAVELRDPGRSDRTIAEIAYRNGFKDAALFTRVFVRHYGVPPSRWRRNVAGPAAG